MNLAIFSELPSNSCGLTTSTCVLGYANAATFSAPSNTAWAIIACSIASCSYYCCTTCSRLRSCQLIVYSGGSDVVEKDDDEVDGGDCS